MNKRIGNIVIALMLMLGLTPSINSPVLASQQYLDEVKDYKLPLQAGETYRITGDGSTHESINGVPRGSIDIPTPYGTPILAMRSGEIVTVAYNVSGGGHLLIVDTNDGFCSVYLHLSKIVKSSGHATTGEIIALSGRGDFGAHTHIAVYSKQGESCDGYGSGPKQREVTIIFDEVGHELHKGEWVTSQNHNNQIQSVSFSTQQNGDMCEITAQINGISYAKGDIWAQGQNRDGSWSCTPEGCNKGTYNGASTDAIMASRPGGTVYNYRFRIGYNIATPESGWYSTSLNLDQGCRIIQ